MKLDSLIESILYFKGEPLSKKELGKILGVGQETLKDSLDTLRDKLENRGLVLVETADDVSLGTSPEAEEVIEKLTKEELEKDLGKAGIETLTIVAYKGPIGRSAIDNIRGVNSSFILRNLMIRGLVDRIQDPLDQRAYLYKPTLELLKYLGISKIDELPEYAKVTSEMKEIPLEVSEENTEKEEGTEETDETSDEECQP